MYYFTIKLQLQIYTILTATWPLKAKPPGTGSRLPPIKWFDHTGSQCYLNHLIKWNPSQMFLISMAVFNGCIALKMLVRSFQQLTKILMGFWSYANHNTANAMVGMYLIIWQLCEAAQQHLPLIKFHQWDKYWLSHSKSASSPSTTTELTVNFRGSYRGSFQKSFLKEIPLFKLKIIIISMCLKRVMGWHFNLIFPRCKIPIFL